MPRFFDILKNVLGEDLTKSIRPIGHGLKGYLASYQSGFPARKLKLIGITGTKGKTSTTVLSGRLLNLAGIKTGYLSTAVVSNDGIRANETLNKYKMTSIDAFAMHRELANMVSNGCEYAIIEMSSEGLKQNRHWGLFGFDEVVFLNIYPEHLESHGSFAKYLQAKSILFKHVKPTGKLIANGENDMANHTSTMIGAIGSSYRSTINQTLIQDGKQYKIIDNPEQMFKSIELEGKQFKAKALATFEITNLAYAFAILKDINISKAQEILNNSDFCQIISDIPGRMEWIVKENILVFKD